MLHMWKTRFLLIGMMKYELNIWSLVTNMVCELASKKGLSWFQFTETCPSIYEV